MDDLMAQAKFHNQETWALKAHSQGFLVALATINNSFCCPWII
jgi:hypothetical protein